jgi:hypothetical protein
MIKLLETCGTEQIEGSAKIAEIAKPLATENGPSFVLWLYCNLTHPILAFSHSFIIIL